MSLSFTFEGKANGRVEFSLQNFRLTSSLHIFFLMSKKSLHINIVLK